jgi:catechol 2,3-dioxygenase-like lactoylglutathione lyase family enzyme
MTTIKALNHAQISIPKGAENLGRAFYCDILGLPEIEKPEVLKPRGGFWLQVGDRQVHVGTEDGVDRHATKAHLAYAVDDILAWREKFTAIGVKIVEQDAIPGYDRFEFRDPFGNRIELTQVIEG